MKHKVYALIFFIVSLCFAPTASEAVDVPDSFINAEVPLYEGATILQAMQTEEFAQVVYAVSTELQEVFQWYKDIMQERG